MEESIVFVNSEGDLQPKSASLETDASRKLQSTRIDFEKKLEEARAGCVEHYHGQDWKVVEGKVPEECNSLQKRIEKYKPDEWGDEKFWKEACFKSAKLGCPLPNGVCQYLNTSNVACFFTNALMPISSRFPDPTPPTYVMRSAGKDAQTLAARCRLPRRLAAAWRRSTRTTRFSERSARLTTTERGCSLPLARRLAAMPTAAAAGASKDPWEAAKEGGSRPAYVLSCRQAAASPLPA